MRNLFLALFLSFVVPACDDIDPLPSSSTTSASTSSTIGDSTSDPTTGDSSSGDSTSEAGPSYVCGRVGQECYLWDVDTGCEWLGLKCFDLGAGGGWGACASECGPDKPCEIGVCDPKIGMCRDADGLPTGQCPGLPQCAGDKCPGGECDAGMKCMYGVCAFACQEIEDCPPGTDKCTDLGACMRADNSLTSLCE